MICLALVVAATFSVEVRGPAWQVEALSATLPADIAGPELVHAPNGELRVAIAIDRELRYVLTRDGVKPVSGVVALGTDRRTFAGVIKDELHRLIPRGEAPAADVELPAPVASFGAFAALAGLAMLLALPLVLARRTRAAPRIAVALGGVAIVGYGITTDFVADSIVFAIGGLAWGAAVAVCIPIALPSLAGLHRVEHRELGRVLRTWLALALQRTLWLAAWLVPIGLVLWLVCDALGVPNIVTFGVIAPLVVLCARLVWRALVEIFAARIDKTAIDDNAEAWHAQIRGYYVGYLRRANLDVDEDLLARVKFLPGKQERVLVYGGGLTHTRVVIGRAMLERALAPYGRPHDYAMPRVSTLHWTHWNAGLVMPSASDEKLATRADREPHHALDEAGERERIALGELPTLTGVIEPVAFDPRTSYRPDEDPLWLDWDPGEEFDGTDAGDRDFLFGVLVHALGIAQRHEDRLATFVHAFPKLRVPAFFARQTTALGDVHAALGGARHHVAQWLAWQLWQREDLLTARAYVPQLEAQSRAILATLDKDTEDDPLHERLRALRHFIDPRAVVKRSQRQRVALAFAVIAAFALVATLVVQAALYHSTYEERRSNGRRS